MSWVGTLRVLHYNIEVSPSDRRRYEIIIPRQLYYAIILDYILCMHRYKQYITMSYIQPGRIFYDWTIIKEHIIIICL